METLPNDFQQDIELVNRISAITNILDVVCRTTGMGFAAVARVTNEKWVALATKDEINFGLRPGGELPLETTICHEISYHHEAVIIDHVRDDEKYAAHHTPLMYGFQSYVSVPIMLKGNQFFGTLCAIDPNPANLKNANVREMFTLFADLISFHINTSRELQQAQSELTEEKRVADLRDQFIAVLGHDLRNPVSAIKSSIDLLDEVPDEKMVKRIVPIIRNSTYRIKELVENILDFARGRLGGGIVIDKETDVPLDQVIKQIVTEIKAVYPKVTIECVFALSNPVHCDVSQIGQLLSNLLNNAVIHGDKTQPIVVNAVCHEAGLTLSVCNSGKAIPGDVLARLFQPFYRGGNKNKAKGLGLGLYIASEIAQAHGGQLTASSSEENTCFSFHLPHEAMNY